MSDFLTQLRELEAKATPGKWELWTSCSFRRITHKADGDVISGCIQYSDGHPDLRASEDDLEIVCFLRNHARAIADLVEAAKDVDEHNDAIRRARLSSALRALESDHA